MDVLITKQHIHPTWLRQVALSGRAAVALHFPSDSQQLIDSSCALLAHAYIVYASDFFGKQRII